MANEVETKVEREARWWEDWFEDDYSWEGLAQHKIHGGGQHGEETLQDYWRRDPESGRMRSDAEMEAAGELVEFGDRRWHLIHLPPRDATSTADSWKRDPEHSNWGRLAALAMRRLASTQPIKGFTLATARDHRARLDGGVLGQALRLPDPDLVEPHLSCARAWIGELNAKGRQFHSQVNFDGAFFLGNADFSSATFSGRAGFYEAFFFRDVDFGGATFTDGAEFTGACFMDFAQFIEAVFEGSVRFDRATFAGTARFDRASFRDFGDFEGVVFAGVAYFIGTSFSTGVRFDGVAFRNDARFDAAVFDGVATFERGVFARTRFDDANFADHMRFDHVRFTDEVFFDHVAFVKGVDFSNAVFSRKANFVDTVFSGPAIFDWVTFLSDAIFARAAFAEDTRFVGASFLAEVGFGGVMFEKRLSITSLGRTLGFGAAAQVDFGGVVFKGPVEFSSAITEPELSFARAFYAARFVDIADFSGAVGLDQGGRLAVAFGEAQFERALILTDGSEANARRYFERRVLPRVLGDGDRDARLRDLEAGCRTVKIAMGKARDELREQRYYRFQLQARQMRSDIDGWEKAFGFVYRVTSDFGSSLWRPLAGIVIATALFGYAYAVWGGALAAGRWEPLLSRDYLFEGQGVALSALKPFSTVEAPRPEPKKERALSGLEASEPSRPPSLVTVLTANPAVTLGLRLATAVQVIVSTLLLFLFGLAVKRRFQIS